MISSRYIITSIHSLVFLEFSSCDSFKTCFWYCLQSWPSWIAYLWIENNNMNYKFFIHWHKKLILNVKKILEILNIISFHIVKFIHTWQVIQLSLLQIGHLKELILSVMKHQPWQSGVLQWNEFLAVTWASFKDFCWCFSYNVGDTSWGKNTNS